MRLSPTIAMIVPIMENGPRSHPKATATLNRESAAADVSASLLFLEKRKTPIKKLNSKEDYRFHVGLVTSVGWTIVKRPTRVYARDAESGELLLDENNEPITDADFNDVVSDLLRSRATDSFPWLKEGRTEPEGNEGWSVSIADVMANHDLILDPKRLNRKFADVRESIQKKAHFMMGEMVDIVPEKAGGFQKSALYRYVEIKDVWDGGYSGSTLRGWQLPMRARHVANAGDIFIGKIWNSVNKWFMAGGVTDDLVITNGFYRLKLKPGKENYLPDIIAGLCSEAYRTQMRGFATGSDGLAEISEGDAKSVVLPVLQNEEARNEARRYIDLFLRGHATLRDFVGELETANEQYPAVPQRKSVFVQV